MRERSATSTSEAGKALCASATHSSGPIPAGSPHVTAISGLARAGRGSMGTVKASLTLLETHVDVSAIAQLPDPFLIRFIGLAGA